MSMMAVLPGANEGLGSEMVVFARACGRYGVRGQAKRDPALPPPAAWVSQAKAPSPLRFAGALHKHADMATFEEVYERRLSPWPSRQPRRLLLTEFPIHGFL